MEILGVFLMVVGLQGLVAILTWLVLDTIFSCVRR